MAVLAYNLDNNGKPIPAMIADGSEILSEFFNTRTKNWEVKYRSSDGEKHILRNTDWDASKKTAEKFFAEGKKQVSDQERDLALGEFGAQGSDAQEALKRKEEGGASGEEIGKGTFRDYDDTDLKKTPEFRALSKEDKEAVLAVFGAIAGNDKAQAARLSDAFQAASAINDPYFSQQLRLAVDAIERGFVSIDKEAEFAEGQLQTRLSDLKEDFENKKEFLNLEQISVMKDIERTYETNLDNLQTGLAATGFSSSSRRVKKEKILEEATGDIRESRTRGFEFEAARGERDVARGERETEKELTRLRELTSAGKLDFLRKAEAEVGTKGLPDLGVGAPDPLGDIFGSLPSEKLQSTISAATSFVF